MVVGDQGAAERPQVPHRRLPALQSPVDASAPYHGILTDQGLGRRVILRLEQQQATATGPPLVVHQVAAADPAALPPQALHPAVMLLQVGNHRVMG